MQSVPELREKSSSQLEAASTRPVNPREADRYSKLDQNPNQKKNSTELPHKEETLLPERCAVSGQSYK